MTIATRRRQARRAHVVAAFLDTRGVPVSVGQLSHDVIGLRAARRVIRHQEFRAWRDERAVA